MISTAKAINEFLISSKITEEAEHTHSDASKRKFYVSDMGKCQRMRWLKRKGISQEFSDHVYWILKIGQMYHDFVYTVLEAKGLLLESEDYVSNDHFVCRFDAICKGEEEKQKDVISIKSTGGWKLNKYIQGELDDWNVAQMMTEIYLLKTEKGRADIEGGRILYINKEPSDKVPVVAFNTERLTLTKWREDKIKEEMDTMVEFWEKDKIPPCTCPAWMRDYNAFQPLCQMSEPEIRKVLENLDLGKKVVTSKKELYVVSGKKKNVIASI